MQCRRHLTCRHRKMCRLRVVHLHLFFIFPKISRICLCPRRTFLVRLLPKPSTVKPNFRIRLLEKMGICNSHSWKKRHFVALRQCELQTRGIMMLPKGRKNSAGLGGFSYKKQKVQHSKTITSSVSWQVGSRCWASHNAECCCNTFPPYFVHSRCMSEPTTDEGCHTIQPWRSSRPLTMDETQKHSTPNR